MKRIMCRCPLPEAEAWVCRAMQPGSIFDRPGTVCPCACHQGAEADQEAVRQAMARKGDD